MQNKLVQLFIEAYGKIYKPLSYIFLFCAFSLNITNIPHGSEGAILALGLVILPLFFEIHKNVQPPKSNRIFENFDQAKEALFIETKKIADSSKKRHTIRYLGLVAFNWPYLERCLCEIINNDSAPPITIELILVDPDWDTIDQLNPTWKSQVISAKNCLKNFFTVNQRKTEKFGWKYTLSYYRCVPFYWGILLDKRILFLGTSYWENGVMRGGHNPIEIYKDSETHFDSVRIQEFYDWFDVLKQGTTILKWSNLDRTPHN